MKDIIRVAVDGPSGAGKSTIAKRLASILGIDYIDTGAMYRAVGYKMIEKGVAMDDAEGLQKLLDHTEIDFSAGNILLDGVIVNDKIRTPQISKQASDCSAIGIVRDKLVHLQREMGQHKSVIMDGRDIGTNVFPDAEYKFFITADAQERAERRYKELVKRGQKVIFEEVLTDIKARDHNDSTREINPLTMADDAVKVDTTDMSIDEVVEYIRKEMED